MPSDEAIFPAKLNQALAPWPIQPTANQLEQLSAHYRAMVSTNRRFNLTRITDPTEAAVKHYADSLSLVLWAQARRLSVGTVLDIGTGAGFPALPLAVMRPDWSITAIESSRKKADFVVRAARTIGLTNLQCIHAHSSQWDSHETFDVVTSRALGKLPEAVEQSARFVDGAGRLVVYKTGLMADDERRAGCDAARRHGMMLDENYAYQLRVNDDVLSRMLLILKRM